MNTDIAALQQQITALQQSVDDLKGHRVNLNTDLFGLIEVVSSTPSGTPINFYDQIKIYNDGTNKRLYVYQPKVGSNAAGWHYTSLT